MSGKPAIRCNLKHLQSVIMSCLDNAFIIQLMINKKNI